MRSLVFLIGIGLLATYCVHAQAPNIDVRKATAEFISDDFDPRFVIRGINCYGAVDTAKAVVKTSTVRTISETYARYKPVSDSVVVRPIKADTSEILVFMHLEGKGLPLPSDSVRGSVRLTVSAAHWDGSDWLGTTSEPFTVPVANVAIPKPIVLLNQGKAEGVADGDTFRFSISSVGIRMPVADTVDKIADVRILTVAPPSIHLSPRTSDSLELTEQSTILVDSAGEYGAEYRIEGVIVDRSKKNNALRAQYIEVWVAARLMHGSVVGNRRQKAVKVIIKRPTSAAQTK